ncbi:hypothetical protein OCK74_19665 [Chitinophagaceae bacterium LB-8]|uniref:Uncharacterized protein n=1 Tax=Paraflavisolibacter caeni TaxID=2982496 RepID=A0A9X3BGQ5_9BACT|nr:hypothetical protein [Paraflavisolibacter caeni]MCU7551349.1 hypothetical protein [Paraflavisolibacter caeni]
MAAPELSFSNESPISGFNPFKNTLPAGSYEVIWKIELGQYDEADE